MTKLLYLTDSYVKSFQAKVLRADEHGLLLDQSHLYPGGGGQPADHGVARTDAGVSFAITGCKRGEDGPLFQTSPGAGEATLQAGDVLTVEIDWSRRYQLMRTHTALHMMSGIVFRDFGAQVTGGNMEPCKGRLDFELAELTAETAQHIERRMAEEVAADREIVVSILPRKEAFQIPDLIRTKINLLPEGIEEVRVVDIRGLDLQADGGTHVARTGEVGEVRVVKYKSKGKGNKRVTIELGAGRDHAS